MTIFEEATELIQRITAGGKLPMFTSCCPAWVKYVEIYYPELLGNLSSCRSPQAMFGSVAKDILPGQLGVKRDEMTVVSIMPCTAKKYEAQLPKYRTNARPDVDVVVTTGEIRQMIDSCGIKLDELEPEAFDMPMGFATGGGVIFGASGGVMEAALRFASEKLTGKTLASVDFKQVRGMDSLKEAELELAGKQLRVAVVHGLANAKKLITAILAGQVQYDFVEVMACPGGCISGGGQPLGVTDKIREIRQKGLYAADKTHQVQKPQDNYLVARCYEEHLGGCPGSPKAHHMLHTIYQNRSQLFDAKIPVMRGTNAQRLPITVTICTKQENCPGQLLLGMIASYIKQQGYSDRIELDAAFSSRDAEDGTICVTVGDQIVERTKFTNATNTMEQLQNQAAFKTITTAIDAGYKAVEAGV